MGRLGCGVGQWPFMSRSRFLSPLACRSDFEPNTRSLLEASWVRSLVSLSSRASCTVGGECDVAGDLCDADEQGLVLGLHRIQNSSFGCGDP